jgi:hypothetical protein
MLLGCQPAAVRDGAGPELQQTVSTQWQTPKWLSQNSSPGLEGFIEQRGSFSLDFAAIKTRLRIDNPCGDIAVKSSNREGWLGASIVAQQAPKATVPSVVYRQDMAGWHIEVRCPGRSENVRTRLDLAVFVPKLLHLELHTTDGNMRAIGLNDAARIETQSGRLVLGSHAAIEVQSDSGNVFLQSFTANTPIRVCAKRGNIELTLPDIAEVSPEGDTAKQFSARGKTLDNRLRNTRLTDTPVNLKFCQSQANASLDAGAGRITLLPGFSE